MSDPVEEVMRKVIPEMGGVPVGATKTRKQAKPLTDKVYRSVNIDVTAEEEKAKAVEELVRNAQKKRKEEEEAQKKQEEVKKMLRGMGFEV